VPTIEAQKLLSDVRSTRDVYARDRMKAENLLLAAQQTVVALSFQLRMAEQRLTCLEDLIGEVRVRMYHRGLESHHKVERGKLPKFTPTVTGTTPRRKSHYSPSFTRFKLTHN
jgi:hypothetical protein